MIMKPRLLALFAHPDDETFRAGGTLALLARRGVRVRTLTATRGQAGSCCEPPLCSPTELPAVREAELRCACAALGIEPPVILDYQDGTLAEVNPDTIFAEILTVVEEIRPSVLLSFGLDGLSGHPDHIAMGKYAFEIYKRSPDIQAIYTMAVPESLAVALKMDQIQALQDEQITWVVDISKTWEAKLAAIPAATPPKSVLLPSWKNPWSSSGSSWEKNILSKEQLAQRTTFSKILEPIMAAIVIIRQQANTG